MTEEWRPVVGFEGLYEVSDQGRVRSLDRTIECMCRGKIVRKRLRGQMLSPGPRKSGHLTVALGGVSHNVHLLVLAAFRGSRPAGWECRHRNGVEKDNRLSNLEYATRSRNTQDRKWHKGCSAYVLTPEQVFDIKARLGPRGMGEVLAREYGVADTTISSIKTGRFHQDIAG